MRPIPLSPPILATVFLALFAAIAPACSATELTTEQQRFLAQYTPELQERLLSLAPERVAGFGKNQAGKQHPLEGKLTARQVMQQLLSDYQAIGSALLMENGHQAAESARRLVDHPSPRGHVFPYIALDKVSEENIRQIPAMWQATFGKAKQLAVVAEAGDLQQAAALHGEILVGCMACHTLFRGTPGVSPRLAHGTP